MAEVFLSLSLDGQAFMEGLSVVLARLGDMSPAMAEAGRAMLSSVALNFAVQGRPDAWRPLAPSTVREKGSSTALFETGRLMGSFGFETGQDFLRVYTPVPYAGVQQEGDFPIPARPFLLFQQEDVLFIKGAVERYLAAQP